MSETMTALEDTLLADSPMSAVNPTVGADGTDNLWMYLNEGKINGIPVVEQFKNLPIDNEALLYSAFILHRSPRILVHRVDPDVPSTLEPYTELLKRSEESDIDIVEELKQYDPGKASFVVWVRYDVLTYELHPRYRYLLEE